MINSCSRSSTAAMTSLFNLSQSRNFFDHVFFSGALLSDARNNKTFTGQISTASGKHVSIVAA